MATKLPRTTQALEPRDSTGLARSSINEPLVPTEGLRYDVDRRHETAVSRLTVIPVGEASRPRTRRIQSLIPPLQRAGPATRALGFLLRAVDIDQRGRRSHLLPAAPPARGPGA